MIYFLLLLIAQQGYSLKILTFKSLSGGDIAHTVLETPAILPPVFTLCSSFKEYGVHDASFFTIFGKSGKPWLTLSNWQWGKTLTMFLKVNEVWVKVREVPLHWMLSWISICIRADTVTGNISISINQDAPLKFVVEELVNQKPVNLKGKLFIGLSNINGPKQFNGELANTNIFSDTKNIDEIMNNICMHVGDVVNTDVLEWKNFGEVKERYEEDRKICNEKQTYTVAIPAKINWDNAKEICPKLGGGNITEPRNKFDIEDTIALFTDMNSTCDYVWTPIVDEEVEGEYKSIIT